MYAFEYHRPNTVAEAVSLLQSTSEPKLLSGGHTLIPTLKQRLASPSDIVDLGAIAELKGIRQEGDRLIIGALTTYSEVVESETARAAIPALAQLASHIGDSQVRNRGTIGGSIANNDPASDYPAAVLGPNSPGRPK